MGNIPTEEMKRRSEWKKPVAAIFIHAGAGYHSTTNEKVHLQACNEYVSHW
jgi:taspase (threonine aspartase 1)